MSIFVGGNEIVDGGQLYVNGTKAATVYVNGLLAWVDITPGTVTLNRTGAPTGDTRFVTGTGPNYQFNKPLGMKNVRFDVIGGGGGGGGAGGGDGNRRGHHGNGGDGGGAAPRQVGTHVYAEGPTSHACVVGGGGGGGAGGSGARSCSTNRDPGIVGGGGGASSIAGMTNSPGGAGGVRGIGTGNRRGGLSGTGSPFGPGGGGGGGDSAGGNASGLGAGGGGGGGGRGRTCRGGSRGGNGGAGASGRIVISWG